MCELLGMSSNEVATLNFSLHAFAEHGGGSGPHIDGWGVAYYAGRDARLVKEAEAAAKSDWVRFIQDHSLTSRLVIAHIRKATTGARTYSNTQPFVRELGGYAHVFAHNGHLAGIFDSPFFQPRRFQALGETDSERAFCELLERMSALWIETGKVPPLEARLATVAQFASELRCFGPANFLYSDGDVLFAHGDRRTNRESKKIEAPGLVVLKRQCGRLQKSFSAKGLSIDGDSQLVSLVASVPLTDEAWEPLEEGEIIVLSGGSIIAKQPK